MELNSRRQLAMFPQSHSCHHRHHRHHRHHIVSPSLISLDNTNTQIKDKSSGGTVLLLLLLLTMMSFVHYPITHSGNCRFALAESKEIECYCLFLLLLQANSYLISSGGRITTISTDDDEKGLHLSFLLARPLLLLGRFLCVFFIWLSRRRRRLFFNVD